MRPMSVQRGNILWFALLTLIIATSIIALPVALSAQSLELLTISSRPEMVTGNDVLIEAHIPLKDAGKHPAITLNGKDVTSAFHPTDSGVLRGLVSGLTPGRNIIEIKVQKKSAQIAVINHTRPITGLFRSARTNCARERD